MPFAAAVEALVDRCPGIRGAAFTDLDGEDIAVSPRPSRDDLRLCAAYGGIALRRLSTSAVAAGRSRVDRVVVRGTTGSVLTLRVGDEYQLVVDAGPGTPAGLVLYHARETIASLEDAI